MPDDYYVSQYSGEEIDALLGSAGAGTVRYDAAQSLTDAQKTQARNNISAMQGIESTDHPGCNYVLNGSTVEWINPPMQLDVEYRTTERYEGKPVYVMTKDYGLVQEKNTPKSENIPENAGYGWVVNGLVTHYGIPIPSWGDDGSLMFGAQYQYGSGKIIFIANDNRVNENAKYLLTIKYVKTTD